MALASGFLAMGKRVLVLDCTDEAKADPRRDTPTTLQRWRKAMSASGVGEDRLQMLACTTREEVKDTAEVQWALNGLRLQPHVSQWDHFAKKQGATA